MHQISRSFKRKRKQQDMEQQKIEHSQLDIRGLSIHVAHVGKAELGTVVFLHGFPEIWYTWRFQMLAVANTGFLAIAPDFRGYGLSSHPPESDGASWEDLVADLVAILDSMSVSKAFVVGKDFGAKTAYDLALLHPERVSGVITAGLPFLHKGLSFDSLPEGFYISRWQEPGRAEADFGRFDIKTVVRNIYILFSRSNIPIAAEGQEIMDLVEPSTPLPSWFTDEDLAAYAALYENSGFGFPLQIPYRNLHKLLVRNDPKVEAPALLIMGRKDYLLKFPGIEESIESGKQFVPDLEVEFIPEGTHFVQEQLPELVNQLIITFLKNHV